MATRNADPLTSCCTIDEEDCWLADGVYDLLPAKEDQWGDTRYEPLMQLEVRGNTVEGVISWSAAATREWQQIRNGTACRGTAWCVQFEAPMMPARDTEARAFWSTGYLHVLKENADGYVAAVAWDHYASRLDLYELHRTAG